jgi:hypothetical protein
MSERRQLINLAYRLLGSLTEAEDAAQDLRPLVRHDTAPAGRHRIPRRLAEQGRQPHLPQPARLARARRETYVGMPCFEPAVVGFDADVGIPLVQVPCCGRERGNDARVDRCSVGGDLHRREPERQGSGRRMPAQRRRRCRCRQGSHSSTPRHSTSPTRNPLPTNSLRRTPRATT